jgi:hypothetical protein
MTRKIEKLMHGFFAASAIAACLLSAPSNAQVVIYPPSAFIATTSPVYYEGHASYWYGNRWWYRDGRSWRGYEREPAYLHDYRGTRGVDRHHYERGNERGHERGHEAGRHR